MPGIASRQYFEALYNWKGNVSKHVGLGPNKLTSSLLISWATSSSFLPRFLSLFCFFPTHAYLARSDRSFINLKMTNIVIDLSMSLFWSSAAQLYYKKKCLNVRQKLGTRNVLKNLKNLRNSHSFTFTTFTLSFTHS